MMVLVCTWYDDFITWNVFADGGIGSQRAISRYYHK